MGEHRVPMLGEALRRRKDPSRSSDPQVRALVAALGTLEIAPAPRADFRAELRAQLVAVTPRLVAEGEATTPAPSRRDAPAGTRVPGADRPRRRLLKPLIAATSVLAAFVLLLGGAVLLSRNALPGDTLYDLKRASENTEYGLAGGATDKGTLKLQFAGRRIGEVAALLPRAGALAAGTGALADDGALNASTTTLVRQTLGSATSDLQSGMRMLTAAAVRGRSAGPLNTIIGWAPGEITEMGTIVARLAGSSALSGQASTLRTQLVQSQQRASALKSDLGCSCLGSSGTDSLGTLPCAAGCSSSRVPGTPSTGTPSTGTSRTSTTPRSGSASTGARTAPAGGATGSGTAARPGSSSSPARGATGSGGAPATSAPGLPTLPELVPSTTPTLPITVNSCGLNISLGPLGVKVGGC